MPDWVIYAAIAASVVSSAAQGVVSYQQAGEQAKQSEYNAEAEAEALSIEANRQQMEFEENRRRTAFSQRRARSEQLSEIAGSGILTGTGTALALEADTWNQQQRELSDQNYMNQLSQRQLNYQAGTALALGKQQASQYRGQRAGIILGTAGNIAGSVASIGKIGSDKTAGGTTGATTGNTSVSNSGGSAGWDGKM
jgi:hypothetical protein